ncbi:hypothetical protein ACHAXS_001554, partial [Conticribra weissflogii]
QLNLIPRKVLKRQSSLSISSAHLTLELLLQPTMSATEAQDPTKSETNKEVRSRKDRPTGSTHFGDTDWDEERPDEIGDATWGEVAQACCVHDAKEWGK